MTTHPIRKFFGLTILYIVIILGIFALQFRNESVISRVIGPLRLILSETKDDNNQSTLKNSFQVRFGGITLYTDSSNHATAETTAGTTELTLASWEEINSTSIKLQFTNGVEVQFSISDNQEQLPFSIKTFFPSKVSSITIPYKINGSYTITANDRDSIFISSKNNQFVVSAAEITSKNLTLTKQDTVALYSAYNRETRFVFNDVLEFGLAQQNAYTTTVQQIKNGLVSAVQNSNFEYLQEKAITAYIAEMAAQGKYSQTISEIPDSVKATSKRTYLSAPYFNTLVTMNRTLIMQNENLQYRSNYSLEQQNLSIFEFPTFGMYLKTQPLEEIRKILIFASDSNLEPNIRQAIGIIQVYTELYDGYPQAASLLLKAVERSLPVIENACQLQDTNLYLKDSTENLSLIETVKAGTSLLKYGEIVNNDSLCATGRLLVNSIVTNVSNISVEDLAEIYPLAITNNKYYPHVEILTFVNETPVWAWTIAQSMSYSVDTANTITIGASFPQGETHYMIVNGINPFTSIEIYNMTFRTDPRFETYNSSGYVYEPSSDTLLLKYQQRSATEYVRLYHTPPAPQVVVEETAVSENITNEQETQEITAQENVDNSSDIF